MAALGLVRLRPWLVRLGGFAVCKLCAHILDLVALALMEHSLIDAVLLFLVSGLCFTAARFAILQ